MVNTIENKEERLNDNEIKEIHNAVWSIWGIGVNHGGVIGMWISFLMAAIIRVFLPGEFSSLVKDENLFQFLILGLLITAAMTTLFGALIMYLHLVIDRHFKEEGVKKCTKGN